MKQIDIFLDGLHRNWDVVASAAWGTGSIILMNITSGGMDFTLRWYVWIMEPQNQIILWTTIINTWFILHRIFSKKPKEKE